MTRPRVVVAGLGDTGLLTASHLSRDLDVVGISCKPGLVSGQELGVRLTRPDEWAREYWLPFERFRRLDAVRTVHGALTGLDVASRTVQVTEASGSPREEPYDVLVIATGVTNGFWRRPVLQSPEEVDAALLSDHERLRAANSVVVIGGGAASVSTAANVAGTWPSKRVDLYFPGERGLPHHHPRVWSRVRGRLADLGVGMHPRHRAVVPPGFDCDRIASGAVEWSTGQAPACADAVVWAIGRVRPNTDWVPSELLDERGFVTVRSDLQSPVAPGVFAVGDVAATDPLRTSARNRADKMLARNIRAHLASRPLSHYRPPHGRWGSVLGVQPDGLTVFTASGFPFRIPSWAIDSILWPLLVRRGIYRGVRSS